MGLKVIRNDITKVECDAIVNSANPEPIVGGGTEGLIYDAAGREKLLEARKKIGRIKLGDAESTPAFDLPCKMVIHTCGPIWEIGSSKERGILKSCYINSLELAYQYKLTSIAFPLISSGIYGFPKDIALAIAENSINEFLETHDMEVYLVVFDDEATKASKTRFDEIKEYVESEYTKVLGERSRNERRNERARYRELEELERAYASGNKSEENKSYYFQRRKEILEGKDINDVISGRQMQFKDKLFWYMDKKGMKSTDVYTNYFDKRTFSKFEKVENYHPSKCTAILCCLGLKLDLDEATDLLASASYAFNMDQNADVIVMFCISKGIYSLMDINEMLAGLGLPYFHQIYR